MCSSGAPPAEPLNDSATRLPEPEITNAMALLADQPPWSTISWTTAARSDVCWPAPAAPTVSHAGGDHSADAVVTGRDVMSNLDDENVAASAAASPRMVSVVVPPSVSSTWNWR